MKILRAALLLLAGCLVATSVAASSSRQQLVERASRDLPETARPAYLDAVPPGLLLFWMDAPDNAVAIRSVADVTGDGKDEVAVGIDESGVDNVFLLDGASSGVATQVWAVETNGGVSGGSPYGDGCIVPIPDTDGNGAQEILVGTAWGGRTAYSLDADAGAERWRFDTYVHPPSGWIYSLTQLNDTTGDGIPEVAFAAGSDADAVYAVSGGSAGDATLLWTYFAADAAGWVANLGDVDGDGAHDPVAAVGDAVGNAVVALDGDPPTTIGVELWSYPTGTYNVAAVAAMPDLTGDGKSEAVAALWTITGTTVRVVNGATGALVWSSTEVFDYGMLVDLLPDVTGDAVPEVIVSTWENAVQVLDGATGALYWKRVVGTENGGDVWSARATPDLNGDGKGDVVAGSFDGYVYAFSGVNGYPFWSYDTTYRLYSVAPLGDLDGDGVAEIGAGAQNPNPGPTPTRAVYVFSGDAGTTLPLFADDFENGEPLGWAEIVG